MYIQLNLNIDKGLERLMYGIDKFREIGFYPYIVCSEETLEYIKYYCLEGNDLSKEHHYNDTEFNGCKIIIDNIYKLGEIILR